MAVPGSGIPSGPGYTPGPRLRFDVIGEAWRLFQQQMSTWIVAMLVATIGVGIAFIIVFFVVNLLFGALEGGAGRASAGLAVGFGLVHLLANLVIGILGYVAFLAMTGGLYRMALKQVRGEPIAVNDLLSVTDVLGPLVVTALLYGIAAGIGFSLCVIPGYIVAGLLMFAIPLVVDKRLAPMDALRTSWETLSPELVMAAVFYFVIALVASLGAYACGIGFLFTGPLLYLSVALVYRDYFDTPAVAGPAGPYSPPTPPAPPTV